MRNSFWMLWCVASVPMCKIEKQWGAICCIQFCHIQIFIRWSYVKVLPHDLNIKETTVWNFMLFSVYNFEVLSFRDVKRAHIHEIRCVSCQFRVVFELLSWLWNKLFRFILYFRVLPLLQEGKSKKSQVNVWRVWHHMFIAKHFRMSNECVCFAKCEFHDIHSHPRWHGKIRKWKSEFWYTRELDVKSFKSVCFFIKSKLFNFRFFIENCTCEDDMNSCIEYLGRFIR